MAISDGLVVFLVIIIAVAIILLGFAFYRNWRSLPILTSEKDVDKEVFNRRNADQSRYQADLRTRHTSVIMDEWWGARQYRQQRHGRPGPPSAAMRHSQLTYPSRLNGSQSWSKFSGEGTRSYASLGEMMGGSRGSGGANNSFAAASDLEKQMKRPSPTSSEKGPVMMISEKSSSGSEPESR